MKRPTGNIQKICRWFTILAIVLGVGAVEIGPTAITAQEEFNLGPAPVVSDSSEFLAAGDLVIGAANAAVDPASRDASQAFYYSNYDIAEPNSNWTGDHSSCNQGTTSSTFKTAVLQRIIYFRAMAGVPTGIGLSETANTADQAAALMFSRNGAISHNPPTSWECYSSSGANASSNSNIAIGWYGTGAVDAYMLDPGSNNGPAGHRRWLLYPQTEVFGTGDVPRTGGYSPSNALWVFDSNYSNARPATRDNYVAWPPPGYVPYQVVYPRWSFSYPGANFGGASVQMRQNGALMPVTVESRTDNGYGENTIVWRPSSMSNSQSWPQPSTDTTYDVTISGISGGPSATISYQVKVFDPATADPGSGGTATASPTPTSGFSLGDIVENRVNLRLRSGAGTNFSTIAILPEGTQGTVTGNPVEGGSYTWVPVQMEGYAPGWVAGRYLDKIADSSSPTPSSTPSATRTPTAARTPTSTSTPTSVSQTPTPTALPGQFPIGASIRTTANLRLRSAPTTSSSTVAVMANGTKGTIEGNPTLANGYTFYPVNMQGYGSGWTAGEYLELNDLPQPTATSTLIPPTSTPTAGGVQIGSTVETTTRVNFRNGAGTNHSVITVLSPGTHGTVTGGPTTAGSYVWYRLSVNGVGTGWLASNYLNVVSGPSATSTPTSPAGGFAQGTMIWVDVNLLNLRANPSISSSVVGKMGYGSRGVVSGSPVSNDGYLWYPLQMEQFGSGWAAGRYLTDSPVAGPIMTATATPGPTDTPTLADTVESAESIAPAVTVDAATHEPTDTPIPPTTAKPVETAVPASGDFASPFASSTVAPEADSRQTDLDQNHTVETAPLIPPPDGFDQPYSIERIQRTTPSEFGGALVDGDLSTEWYASADEALPVAAFVVDLGVSQPIGTIGWIGGPDGISGNLVVSVSTDGETWSDIDLGSLIQSGNWSLLPNGSNQRYVRFAFINSENADWLGGIAEVAVWSS